MVKARCGRQIQRASQLGILAQRERERDQLGITESGSGFTVQEYMYVYCVKGNKLKKNIYIYIYRERERESSMGLKIKPRPKFVKEEAYFEADIRRTVSFIVWKAVGPVIGVSLDWISIFKSWKVLYNDFLVLAWVVLFFYCIVSFHQNKKENCVLLLFLIIQKLKN